MLTVKLKPRAGAIHKKETQPAEASASPELVPGAVYWTALPGDCRGRSTFETCLATNSIS